jgi:hypothetical protein
VGIMAWKVFQSELAAEGGSVAAAGADGSEA